MDVWHILERAATRWPDREAVVDGDVRRTWREVRDRAAGLAARLDVDAGDRVAYLGRNSIDYLEAYFGVAGAGATLVPLNTRAAAAELDEVLRRARPRALIHDADLTPPRLDGDVFEAGTWQPGEHDAALVAPGAPAQLYFTSGTTGRAKGVVLTHANVCEHALAATSELDLAEDDVWGHVAPMFHLADAWATFALTWVGGRHVMAPRFDAREVLRLFQGAGVTVTNLVPTMLVRLVAEAEAHGAGDHALRLMLSGGAPVAPDTVRRALDVFGCEYAQTYGMTETSPYLTLGLLRPHHLREPVEAQLARRCRTGRPFETVEVQVVDDAGAPVPADDRAVGEIRVRGATVSPGYWEDPEETARAFRDGWLYTGDLARVDAEGYLDIVDRRKDMILTGGENVYTVEVEQALTDHPAVLEAAAFGVPDPEWGQAVRAAVVLGSPTGEAQLVAHCRSRLAGYKCPRVIEVRDTLPRTGSGKVSKAALRAEHEERRA